ncbi:hypothetical protein ACA910_016115 [Epithemia clementina (nom. ined.)]
MASSSSSSSSDNTKLVVTAVGAALAGASISLAISQFLFGKRRRSDHDHNHGYDRSTFYNPSSTRSLMRESRTSYIFEDGKGEAAGSNSIVFPHNHEEKMRRLVAARAAIEEDNSLPRQSVTVRVPATSANMGPGYDTIGMAVDLWSEVTVERSDTFEITAEGDGADKMPTDESNYMVVGVKAAFQAANKPMPTLKYHVVSRIPFARGLGSSSAGIVAGIIAGLILAGHRLPCWGSEALLQIAAGIEGHPDNVAPAIYGGIQTSDARGVLQPTITRTDAAFNIGRASWLVLALCLGNLDNLKWAVQDKMHQPQRAKALYKYLYPMVQAAEDAGATCAYLSGAGPTVMAITGGASGDIFAQRTKERSDLAVAKAMMRAAADFGMRGKLVVTSVSNEGARVVKVEPPFSSGDITYRDNI